MKQPNWKDAPEWANWVAMDEDGQWYWHECEPIISESGVWKKTEGKMYFANPFQWKDTLQKRPEED